MSGYIGPIPVPQGIQNKETFTATASQTTFNTNGYTDGDFINVYLNGVRLVNGTDYTATNGSDIVLTTGASASDVLDFETFNEFSLASQQFENITLKNPTHEDTDGGRESAVSFKGEQSGGEISTLAQIQASHDGTSDDQKGDLIFKTNDGSDNDAPTERMRIDSAGTTSITVIGNEDTLNLISTDADASFGPVLNLHRNSASPANNDATGRINFQAENDADEKITYAQIYTSLQNVADSSEDGTFKIGTMGGGNFNSRIDITNTETVFNDDSKDLNFRVESDGNANMLFVDAGNNIVGIGRTPSSSTGSVLQLEGSDGMAMRRPSQTNSFTLRPLSSGDGMRFTQEGTGDRVTIDSDGAVKMSGNAGTFTTGLAHTAENNAANTYTFKVRDHTTNPLAQYLVEFMYNNATPDNNTAKFLQCRDATAARLNIDSDGDIYNHDGTYGSISDEKLKEQISDASEQWDDIKALRIRKFKFKTDVATGDSDNHWRLGVIAQEVEASGMTKLIKEEADIEVDDEGVISQTGTTTKIVKYSILYMKAVKALQEAMTRIETLETKVAALEAE